MESVDFTTMSPDEIYDFLVTKTLELSEYYKAALPALPSSDIIAAYQNGDPQKTFFVNAGNTHLPVLASSVNSMRAAPTQIFPPIGLLNETVD